MLNFFQELEEDTQFMLETFRYQLLWTMQDYEITQEELAKKIGISRESLNKWLNGNQIPKLDHFIKLCLFFRKNNFPTNLLNFNYLGEEYFDYISAKNPDEFTKKIVAEPIDLGK